MITFPHRMRAFTHDCGGSKHLRNTNVLIYWPHGFGDWVQLCYISRLLEPSNRYWITRFGDDNVSLVEGQPDLTPIYLGVNSTHSGDGEAYANRHFGLEYDEIDGSEFEVHLPANAFDICVNRRIEVIFWSSYPETHGIQDPPFHSKARQLIPWIVRDERLNDMDLGKPLRNAISFEIDPWISRWGESRLPHRLYLAWQKLGPSLA